MSILFCSPQLAFTAVKRMATDADPSHWPHHLTADSIHSLSLSLSLALSSLLLICFRSFSRCWLSRDFHCHSILFYVPILFHYFSLPQFAVFLSWFVWLQTFSLAGSLILLLFSYSTSRLARRTNANRTLAAGSWRDRRCRWFLVSLTFHFRSLAVGPSYYVSLQPNTRGSSSWM